MAPSAQEGLALPSNESMSVDVRGRLILRGRPLPWQPRRSGARVSEGPEWLDLIAEKGRFLCPSNFLTRNSSC
jgi:hypothetical protein